MNTELRSLRDLPMEGRRVLVRVDFNVPLDDGTIADDSRIRAALPSIELVLQQGGTPILMSHLGRPGGEPDPGLSLEPVAARLQELLGRPVAFVPDSVGDEVRETVESLQAGDVLLLENTRFHAGEKAGDDDYARRLASLADCFVNDAFGSAHRAHASTVGVARHLPSAAGLLMEREVATLGRLLAGAERPFVVIMGGAKTGGKLGVMHHLLDRADRILTGGAIANTLLRAAGHDMAESLIDEACLDDAGELLTKGGGAIELPTDLIIADRAEEGANMDTVAVGDLPAGWRAVDIGNGSLRHYESIVDGASTIFWNGPLGMAEIEAFAGSTLAMAKTLAELDACVVVGGGDTVAAIERAGVADRIDHLSTGGGASLAFLEGKSLPALDVLRAA